MVPGRKCPDLPPEVCNIDVNLQRFLYTYPIVQLLCYISVLFAAGAHRIFKFADQVTPKQRTTWHQIDRHFTATEYTICITISSLGGNDMGAAGASQSTPSLNVVLAVDDVHVTPVNVVEGADASKAVGVTAQHNRGQSNIAARWTIEDDVAPVVETLWAIGTPVQS